METVMTTSTTFTAYSLQMVLRDNAKGNKTAGYTTKPGSGCQGLFIYARNVKRGEYLGFNA